MKQKYYTTECQICKKKGLVYEVTAPEEKIANEMIEDHKKIEHKEKKI